MISKLIIARFLRSSVRHTLAEKAFESRKWLVIKITRIETVKDKRYSVARLNILVFLTQSTEHGILGYNVKTEKLG